MFINKSSSLLKPVLSAMALSLLCGCAAETHQALVVDKVNSATTSFTGVRSNLVIGKFNNRSNFGQGIFSNGNDNLGSQAKTILISHLQQTNHFNVMDRDNMEEARFEANLGGKKQALKGASYLVTGDITAFGRKEIGDQQFFGVLGRGKSQTAYAKVTLNVVDAVTLQIVYSVQGAGEYALSNREVIGFGGTAAYDSTLNGKVLDLAIREAVNRLVEGVDQGTWKPNN